MPNRSAPRRAKGERSRRRPRARLGQHFLTAPAIPSRIASLLDLVPGETLLEIGPGLGALTRALAERFGRLVAVEFDRDLVRRLKATFAPDRVVVVEGDILEVSLDEVAAAAGASPGSPFVVAGNLPYGISKPLALRLVRERDRVRRAVLMFQKEVADRLTAVPCSRDYGPMGILAGFAYGIERAFDVPRTAFRPPPQVLSSVTAWRRREPSPLAAVSQAALRTCLSASFASRRRTLYNNLRAALPGGDAAATDLLGRLEIDGSLRAEQLAPDLFLGMARLWPLESSRTGDVDEDAG